MEPAVNWVMRQKSCGFLRGPQEKNENSDRYHDKGNIDEKLLAGG